MLRIAVVYVLIATTVLVYLVVESNDGVMLEKFRADIPGSNVRAEKPVRGHALKMVGPSRPLSKITNERRLSASQKMEMIIIARELQQVSEHVDWEKLRDQYLLAIYSEEPSNHRKLKKKRAPRPRIKGRTKDWHVNDIESKLEQEAAKAIEEARGIATRKGVKKRVRKGDGGNKHSKATSVPKGAGKVQAPENVTSASPSFAPVTSLAPVDTITASPSFAPVGSLAPVATIAPASPPSSADINRAADSDEFPIHSTGNNVDTVMADVLKKGTNAVNNTNNPRKGDEAEFNGKPIENYTPSKGNCPDPGDVAANPIPCAPDDLSKICNKYDDAGSFKACFEACKPSFCCVHDAPPASNTLAPSCYQDVNCAQYGYCYIVWWKLHDTIGPATSLRVEQNDDFFDITATEIDEDPNNADFYIEMLFHHFDNSTAIVELGTVQVNSTLAVFSSDVIFLNSTYWNTTI